MKLPNLSNSMYVAQLRYIQSIHEAPDRSNPDELVRHFIPRLDRWRSAWLANGTLSKLRADPFYYYLVARTRYYDQVLTDAIANGVKRVVMIGCGSDTRSHRFMDLLAGHGVNVLECDQLTSIRAKQRMAKRWQPLNFVEYLPIDLNDDGWPQLVSWLNTRSDAKTLALMEGVSPYINERSFSQFLSLISETLTAGSLLAYDFKIQGVKDDFGREGRTEKPFRLTTGRPQVSMFHAERGLRLDKMELSSELSNRLLPGVAESGAVPFSEDGLLRLEVDRV